MWRSSVNKRRATLPRISDAEWAVMKVLWGRGALTTSQIVAELKQSTDWKPQTVHTLLARLAQKGALNVTKRNREHEYRARVSEAECEHAITRSFLTRFFDGQLSTLVARFVEREKLSAKQIDELKRILNSKP